MRELMTTGEFAALCETTKETLRHYIRTALPSAESSAEAFLAAASEHLGYVAQLGLSAAWQGTYCIDGALFAQGRYADALSLCAPLEQLLVQLQPARAFGGGSLRLAEDEVLAREEAPDILAGHGDQLHKHGVDAAQRRQQGGHRRGEDEVPQVEQDEERHAAGEVVARASGRNDGPGRPLAPFWSNSANSYER
ncbi:MAG: hypothetical protein ACI36W_00125, partial [Coriobacteriales bacterium]